MLVKGFFDSAGREEVKRILKKVDEERDVTLRSKEDKKYTEMW